MEWTWLYDVRHGCSFEEIARRDGVSVGRVRFGIERAREADGGQPAEDLGSLRLVPHFPIGSFTPSSQCPHHGPIRRGSYFVCMVCHQSGMDHHPALRGDSR